MIKSIGKLTLATILAAVVLGMPMGVQAQTPTPPPAAPAAPSARPKPSRITGKLVAVDKVNKTITVGVEAKHVIAITSTTKITKGGKPATLDDGVVGDDVYANCTKTGDGDDAKLTARSVRFGPAVRPAPVTSSTPAPPKAQ